MEKNNEELNYEILKDFGVLEKQKDNWVKKFVYISWYDREPAFEIRSFNGNTAGKLAKLTTEGMQRLKEIISSLEF